VSVNRSWGTPILIVEDDPLIGELLVLRFKAAGYRTTLATDGHEALDRIFEVRPRLVLLDLGLPLIDGFEVLTQIRRHRVFAKTYIVVLTASNSADDIKRALAAGANDYVAKPFDAVALVKRVERHLAPKRAKPAQPSKPVKPAKPPRGEEWMI
jgi:DNA-binding response OmpR family regulator